MTFPQIKLYLESFAKRCEMEAEVLQSDVTGDTHPRSGKVEPMRVSDMPDFGIAYRKPIRKSTEEPEKDASS